MTKPIKFFNGAVGFSFWHHYGNDMGTGILIYKLRTGLFGLKIVRWDHSNEVRAIALGFWWSWEFSMCAIPFNLFKE